MARGDDRAMNAATIRRHPDKACVRPLTCPAFGNPMRTPLAPLLASALLLPVPAFAVDYSTAVFGTLGYARSDHPFVYQRSIDDNGTFLRDSVLGAQLDLRFSPQWSATLQGRIAAANFTDDRLDATLSWAFVSWRPSNDWQLRAGRLRVPGYLNAENMDVGATFDYARLPAEAYSVSSVVDFVGGSALKTWTAGSGDISLEAYWGRNNGYWRQYFRTSYLGTAPAGDNYLPLTLTIRGLSLAYRNDEDVYKASYYLTSDHLRDGNKWVVPTLETPAPGVSYYNVIPGGPNDARNARLRVLVLGADVGIGNGYRLAGEAFQRKTLEVPGGFNSTGGYLALRKQIGQWTPYVYHARLRSEGAALDLYRAFNNPTVPAAADPTGFITAMQKSGADAFGAYDQATWSIGSAYALTPTSKLKAEWSQTRVGTASSLVDTPAGEDVSHQRFNVLSLSYSFVF